MSRTVDFSIKEGDTAPAFTAQLVDSAGQPVSLLNVVTVTFVLADLNKSAVIRQPAEILSTATSIVRYRWRIGDTDVPGRYLAEWEVMYDDDSIETFPNGSYNSVRINADLRSDVHTVSASDSGSLGVAQSSAVA